MVTRNKKFNLQIEKKRNTSSILTIYAPHDASVFFFFRYFTWTIRKTHRFEIIKKEQWLGDVWLNIQVDSRNSIFFLANNDTRHKTSFLLILRVIKIFGWWILFFYLFAKFTSFSSLVKHVTTCVATFSFLVNLMTVFL